MAFAYTVDDPVVELLHGKKHVVYAFVATEVGTTDEIELDVPTFFTVTLFECELTDAGSATQIDPDLLLTSGGTLDTLDEVAENASAGTYVRSQDNVRVTAVDGKLYIVPAPDAEAAEISGRITFIEGHIV